MTNLTQKDLIVIAIIMYDVDGHDALLGIPEQYHQAIIEANRDIDDKVMSNEESGYDTNSLLDYANSMYLKIKEGNRWQLKT